MRYGFTTGSCAAAAAKAAAYMLLTGTNKEEISIETPNGILYKTKIHDICKSGMEVSCAVEKDGGDDPDVTTGAMICATVSIVEDEAGAAGTDGDADKNTSTGRIVIDGGAGVGRVTRPGLDQPVGNAAINHVPREMIEREVRQVCELTDYRGDLKVVISVPEGEAIAEKTFNQRLGITGGISILGTSGIVEPMSTRAILDTIKVELSQRKALGYDHVVISPGNYGRDHMQKTYGYDLDRSVKCSNFIGDTLDMAVEIGFGRLLLTGHIGKLIKVVGGMMNTHSAEGDCRMEILAALSVRAGIDIDKIRAILDCLTTEEALRIIRDEGRLKTVMDMAMDKICYYLDKRVKGRLQIDCIMYSNEFGELAVSKGVEEWSILLAQEQEL
ncbi:MAG: cobalt-precorrin-5B (C(1))-methyltransferase CbiD [Lachnospiraceae bacterium]|nr:cobalt-precorrin-5B (C(1))-methyltransferase CbiD [Lachnospiraceae bacterium]